MGIAIINGILSRKLLNKANIGIIKPFEVLSFDVERECIMFINRPVLDFIDLIKLSFENNKVSALLRIQVNNLSLKLFKSIYNLKEVTVFKEEAIVSLLDLLDNVFDWVQEGVLIKVFLQGTMLEFTKSDKKIMLKNVTYS
jgi:hypothetical protein